MIEYYSIKWTLTNPALDEMIYSNKKVLLTDENLPEEETVNTINWENLDNFIKRFPYINVWISGNPGERCFKYYSDKKIFLTSYFKIRESKNEILELKIEISVKKEKPSLKTILEYPDCDKAIQYLKERGLNICPAGLLN